MHSYTDTKDSRNSIKKALKNNQFFGEEQIVTQVSIVG